MFVGRRKELEELIKRFNSGRFEFGVIYGARRIGKTSLLDEFVKKHNAFRFQARKGTEEENLRIFSKELNNFRGLNGNYSYESFEAAFEDVCEYAKKERFLFVIDEVAYLCAKSQSLLSTIQYFTDGSFRESGMMLILSGSNISFMENILNNRYDPLYKRATFQINLKSLPFSEALQFLDGMTQEEKIKYLALFGGHPYYLAMIDQRESFEENIKNLLFSEYGTLCDAPEKVLPPGTSDVNMYNSILRSISCGKRFTKEIAETVGEESNYVSKYLNSLIEMQVIERREAYNRNRKLNYYEISDHLLRFWFRFVYLYRDQITQGLGEAVFQSSRKEIESFIAYGFEYVALNYMTEQNISGKLPGTFDVIRNYKVDNSQLGRSIELDGLAKGLGNSEDTLLVIECKYRNSAFTQEMLEHLKESVSIFSGFRRYEYYLFSKSGFENIDVGEEDNIHLIDLTTLLKQG